MSSKSAKRQHIVVDAEAHEQLTSYSEVFGTPIGKLASSIIKDWMETVGQARLEAMMNVPGPRVLMMPPTKEEQASAASAGQA